MTKVGAKDDDLIPPSFDEVKEIALKNIESLCGRLLPNGTKRGNAWVASVPWRIDKKPSLSVLFDKACWQDFGRPGDGGSVIDLVMRLDNCDAPTARNTLAEILNIPFTKKDKDGKPKKVIKRNGMDLGTLKLNGEAIPFLAKKDGSPKPLFINAVTLLNSVKAWEWKLEYDDFSNRAFCQLEPLTDSHLRQIAGWVQQQGVECGTNIIAEAVIAVAEQNRFHPVKEYLRSLEWDGIPRIDMALIDHAGAADTELNRALFAKYLVQAVARIYQPGCAADATLVLEGTQGIGKSTLFRELFGDRWFTDHLPDLANKDALLQLRGVWCVEIAELASLGRSDSAKIKQFLTSRIDRYRDPYGRLVADFPRTCVFAGTVNPGAEGYLKDPTGARRFWPVAVSAVDLDMIRSSRDQYWAEAMARYQAGENWHLDDDMIAAASTAQAERYEGDPWDEEIEKYIYGKVETTTADILRFAISITATADWGRGEQMRVGRCLTNLGWVRKRRKVGNSFAWVYVRHQPKGEQLEFVTKTD